MEKQKNYYNQNQCDDISLSLSAQTFLHPQVYGTRNADGMNRNALLTNGLGIGEDPHVPVNLQLCQPQQQNYEPPTRITNLG